MILVIDLILRLLKMLGSLAVEVVVGCNALFSTDVVAKDDDETIVSGKIDVIEGKESFDDGTCHITKILGSFVAIETKSIAPNFIT